MTIGDATGYRLARLGHDWILDDGRRLVISYASPRRRGRDFFLGLPNRLRDDDVLVLLLGEHPVVFERAEQLLAYSPYMSRSNDGRPNPRFREVPDIGIVLSVRALGLELPMAERVAAYQRIVPALPHPTSLGRPFRRHDEQRRPSRKGTRNFDSGPYEESDAEHRRLVNRLAQFVTERGATSVEEGLPSNTAFDLAWREGALLAVAEVKSCTTANQVEQLRLGLGQLLQYRQVLREAGLRATGVLCIEQSPQDMMWLRICHAVEVLLVWPEVFSALDSLQGEDQVPRQRGTAGVGPERGSSG